MQIPVCLWFLTRNKTADAKRNFRARPGETLFIDARRMGTLIDRVHRELTPEDIALREIIEGKIDYELYDAEVHGE